jgi:hypothetical protein
MSGRKLFSELVSKMSPEAQSRIMAKVDALRNQMKPNDR